MAVEADRVVVEVVAELDNAGQSVRRYSSDFEAGANRVTRAATSIEKSTDRVSFATRNLGFQISDIGQQVTGGTSPFVIIGQQAPQVLQALEDINAAGATLGQTLRSIALPGILAVATAAAALAERFFESSTAAKDKKKAVDALKEAMDRLAGASATLNAQTELGIRADIRAAETMRLREIGTRRQIEAELELAKARLSAAQVSEATGLVQPIPGRGAASQQAIVADLTARIAEQDSKIAEAERNIRSGQAELVVRKIAAATDQATAATQRYQNALDQLQRRFEAGSLGKDEFEQQGIALKRQLDANLKAIADGRTATRKAARDAETEARREAAELAKLRRELGENNLAGELRRDNQGLGRHILGNTGFDDIMKEISSAQKGRVQEMEALMEEQKRKQENDLRELSGLYYDLFSRGTRGFWDEFKHMGLRVLAELAAKKTLAFLSDLSGGGGLGGALTGLFGLGRASGGPTAVGTLYRVNEGAGAVKEGFVPNVPGKIVPLGQMGNASQSGSGVTVLQTIAVDARGAVMNDQFAELILRRADQRATKISGAMARAAYEGSPSRLQRQQTLGT